MTYISGLRLDCRTVALLAIAVAMGMAGRLAFLWWPNVMLSYFIVAAVAIAYHPLLGALTGALTMLLTDMVVGFAPTSLFTITGLAIFGLAIGVFGRAAGWHRRAWGRPHAALAWVLGSGLVAAYSLYTDLGTTLFLVGGGGDFLTKYAVVATAGLAFNIPMMAVNGALFGLALHPVLDAVQTIQPMETFHETREAPV